jgi:hypothetical protein
LTIEVKVWVHAERKPAQVGFLSMPEDKGGEPDAARNRIAESRLRIAIQLKIARLKATLRWLFLRNRTGNRLDTYKDYDQTCRRYGVASFPLPKDEGS